MVEDRGHGLKRKLTDTDGDLQTRCYQRQTIFNISICKLRKNCGNVEPLLSKTVLIANTIRMIEDDIEEEQRQIKQLFCGASCSDSASNSSEADTRKLATQDSMFMHSRSREVSKKPLDSLHFEKEMNLLGDKIIRELGLDYAKDCDRRDRIPWGEKTERVTDLNNNAGKEKNNHDYERDVVSCSSLLGLELSDELEFGDVDLSLYDFDASAGTLSVDAEEVCAAWSLPASSFPSRCSDSVKLERTNENFDELDQVMQILVGS